MTSVIGTVTRIDYTPLPSSSNFTLSDGPDTVYIYIDNTTEIDISGMDAVILGRSNIVGKQGEARA